MKPIYTKITLLSLIAIMFTSCSAIEGIFKAGMGVGIFMVIAVIAVVLYLISRFSGKK